MTGTNKHNDLHLLYDELSSNPDPRSTRELTKNQFGATFTDPLPDPCPTATAESQAAATSVSISNDDISYNDTMHTSLKTTLTPCFDINYPDTMLLGDKNTVLAAILIPQRVGSNYSLRLLSPPLASIDLATLSLPCNNHSHLHTAEHLRIERQRESATDKNTEKLILYK